MKVLDIPSLGRHLFWCEPCNTRMWWDDDRWSWNGDYDHPTVQGSIKWMGPVGGREDGGICHLLIEDGFIHYCADCTHELAGQTVSMQDVR